MIKTGEKRKPKILFTFIRIFIPVLIIILILSYSLINIKINTEKEIIRIRQLENAKIVNGNINSIFKRINSDINVILNSNEMKSYLNDIGNSENINSVTRMFSNMSMNNGVYDQMRIIDNNGFEAVGVNYNDQNPQIINENNLQYKGDQTYFTEGIKLNKEEIYISQLDLHTENNIVQTPIKPIIRLATPLYNEKNEKSGVLVLNYLAQNFLNQIESDSKNNSDIKLFLLNDQGYYLLSDQKDKNFSFMYDNGANISFNVDKPIIWKAIETNISGYYEDNENLYYYNIQYPSDQYKNIHWNLVYYYPLTNLSILNNDETRIIVVGSIISIIILLIISYIISFLLLLKSESNAREKVSQNIFEDSREGILITDEETNIIYVNKAFSEITGYTKKEVIGEKPGKYKSGEQSNEFYDQMWLAINKFGRWQGELTDKKKNGTLYPKYLSITKISDNKSTSSNNYFGIFEDLTVIKKGEEVIKKITNFDANTGLPNQSLFEKTLTDLIKKYDRIGIIILQITNFDDIYDNLGKKYGLDIIKEASHRIKIFLGDDDLFARFHKDEFAIAQVNPKNKLDIDSLIKKIISSLNESIVLNNEKIFLDISIGISLFQEDSVDVINLIAFANIAKNYSIQTGKNGFVYYDQEIKANYRKNLKLETHLRSALEKKELSLSYQPQVVTKTGEIIGMEALLRWQNAELGNVDPDGFISIAEKTDLIIPIGNWVLEEAIRQNKKWHDITNKKLIVAVNISPIQFKKTNVSEIIQHLLLKYSLLGEFLEIEITEGVLVENFETIKAELQKIKSLGVKISIDDFGTGYSSLRYLRKLDFDKLKIDREFIKDYPDKDNGIIAKIIVNLSQILGLRVIAEGVENEEQFLYLKNINCDEIQGYYFHKPLTSWEFEELIKKNRKIE